MTNDGMYAASYANLRQHPKFRKLVRKSGLHEATVKGALQLLWEYCTNVIRGDFLGRADEEDLGYILGLPDDIAVRLFQAMVDVHFIDEVDGEYFVHDWEDHKSPYLRRLETKRNWHHAHKSTKLSEQSRSIEKSRDETPLDGEKRKEKKREEKKRGDDAQVRDIFDDELIDRTTHPKPSAELPPEYDGLSPKEALALLKEKLTAIHRDPYGTTPM